MVVTNFREHAAQRLKYLGPIQIFTVCQPILLSKISPHGHTSSNETTGSHQWGKSTVIKNLLLRIQHSGPSPTSCVFPRVPAPTTPCIWGLARDVTFYNCNNAFLYDGKGCHFHLLSHLPWIYRSARRYGSLNFAQHPVTVGGTVPNGRLQLQVTPASRQHIGRVEKCLGSGCLHHDPNPFSDGMCRNCLHGWPLHLGWLCAQ